MTGDAGLLRGLAGWFDHRPGAVVLDLDRDVTTAEVADALRRIADQLGAGPIPSLRERLETAERERADAVSRANAALIKAGDEAGRLREELERAYAAIGRDYLERLRLAALEDR